MNAALIYSSSYGKTRKVVRAVLPRLAVESRVYNVTDIPSQSVLLEFDLLLLFTPTYGDEELQEEMERFVAGLNLDLSGRTFAICELGSYYGYDDFSFGAMRILRRRLLELNALELCSPLSLDSLPRLAWDQLWRWIQYLNAQICELHKRSAIPPFRRTLPSHRDVGSSFGPASQQASRQPVKLSPDKVASSAVDLQSGLSHSEARLLKQLHSKIGTQFPFRIENGCCVSIDLTSNDALFHGLIRHHSPEQKQQILNLICGFENLRELNLRRNHVGRLPPQFRRLKNLEFLNLGSNALSQVPQELGSLTRLKFLHLGNNGIKELPGFIGDFQSLESLALHKNIRLRSVDPIRSLHQLRQLNLFYANLQRLPPFIYSLENLVSLTVWNIAEIEEQIAQLTQLEFFTNCGATGLRRLPQTFVSLRKLRMLRLFQNSLETLPENLGNLDNLEQLSLYQQHLSRLPDSCLRLQKLKKLNIGWNHFRQLPTWLAELRALEWLAVFQNPLANHEFKPPPHAIVIRDWPFSTVHENRHH